MIICGLLEGCWGWGVIGLKILGLCLHFLIFILFLLRKGICKLSLT